MLLSGGAVPMLLLCEGIIAEIFIHHGGDGDLVKSICHGLGGFVDYSALRTSPNSSVQQNSLSSLPMQMH